MCLRSPCLTKLDVIALCEGFAQESLPLVVLIPRDISRPDCTAYLHFDLWAGASDSRNHYPGFLRRL